VTSIDLPNRQPSLSSRALFAWGTRWSWLLCWMAAALVAIFQHGPMPMYSTRTLSVAWEMWLRHSYLVPYFNGQPYSDKPPLLLWLIQLGWAVGGVSDIWPRLLEVMLGAIELVLAARLARRLFAERPLVAQIAPWILAAFTYGFMFGLQVMYEVLLADCVLAALLCLVPMPQREAPRFAWFALAVSLGLLTKGPVMLLHVAFPWLLGPLWQPWAKREPRRWYVRGGMAIAAGCAVLLTWALLAAWSGGEAYRQKLLVHQTAGRVVDAFAHAEPFWWYVPMLPVLVFPFVLWPRLWLALWALRRPFEPGLRFLFVWLGPVLLGFSLVSGKQAYYLLPEYAGFALLMAAALTRLYDRPPVGGRWLGPWPMALLIGVAGVALICLGSLVKHATASVAQLTALVPYSVPFGVLFVAVALMLAWPRRGELHRVAIAGLVATVVANGLFSMTLWPAYDFAPAAALLAKAEAKGQPVANLETNDGQFTFLGRLTRPITQFHGHDKTLKDWAMAHPDGLIITYPQQLTAAEREQAVYTQPFRGVWLAIWPAAAYAEAQKQELP
jgi:4-amino-4-deoxy-L-arabinose transferase-like glycosyltransferase